MVLVPLCEWYQVRGSGGRVFCAHSLQSLFRGRYAAVVCAALLPRSPNTPRRLQIVCRCAVDDFLSTELVGHFFALGGLVFLNFLFVYNVVVFNGFSAAIITLVGNTLPSYNFGHIQFQSGFLALLFDF